MENETGNGSIVVITGASKGIGKAIAEKFVAEGETVLLCARNEENLLNTARELKEQYPGAIIQTFVADLSDKVQVAAFAQYCLGLGTPSILVNNAGSYLPGNIQDEPEGQLETVMNTNLFSAYHLTRKLLPAMIKKGSGHIFNICSIASLQAYEGGGSYSISKYALNGFSKNLRHELKQTGIKVTAVFPGAVMTASWGSFDNSSNRIMEAEDIANIIVAATKLSSQAVVEDIVIRPQLGDL
ncbi:MAG: SDR family oxidoreductase [Gloeobacteraceae cyanobacterium ES-bin-316]|nr:SDR family oxidoreductase [Ferruginibacter sp.]